MGIELITMHALKSLTELCLQTRRKRPGYEIGPEGQIQKKGRVTAAGAD